MAVDWVGKGIGKIARGITGLKPVVIEWTNWKEGDIVWKYPEEVIPWGSVVVVKEMEAAIFYRDGKVYGLLKAGRHVLDTANVPFLKGLVEGLYGTSIFRCMVIFVSLRRFDGKFGGQTQTIELAPLKFHGKFYFRVTDPVLFVNKVVGPQNLFTTEELSEYLRGYFNSKIMAYLSRFSLRDVFYRQLDVQEKVMMQLKSDFKELGLDLEKVVFEGLETTEQWRKTLFWVQTTAAVPTAPYVLQMQTAKEVAKELGRLFRNAVRKCVNSNERIGVSLSGGLDSRAVLAAVPEDYKPLHTFTFGQEGCDDIKIARKVSEIKGAKHHVLILNSNNWLVPRINGVWKSDASFSLLHMHGMEFYNVYKSHIDFNLDGFLGDAILGGSYISNDQSMEYKVRNRGRRFINQAVILMESWLIHRRPFFDKDLTTLILSIPESLRQDSYIYNKMLLSTFPEYYSSIPWQKTGCPISYPNRLVKLIKFKNWVVRKLRRESGRFGFTFKDLRTYTDYPSWIRQEPARPFFEKLLLSKDAMYPEYIDKNKVRAYISKHMGGKANYHNELCLALTFELWLQQVFEGKYRDTKEKLL